MNKPVPLLVDFEEAQNAIAAAREYLDEGQTEHAQTVLRRLRRHFPADWNMPKLDLKIDDPHWGDWQAVTDEIIAAVNAALIDAARRQDRSRAANTANARKARKGRFPAWMKEQAIAFYKSRTIKPSGDQIVEYLAKIQHKTGDESELPSKVTALSWIKTVD